MKVSVLKAVAWLVFSLAFLALLNALYMPAKAVLAQVLLEHAWQKTLDSGLQHRPWPWADTTTMAKINFPTQQTQFVVLTGSTGPSLAFGPGHLHGSRTPTEAGHMVISGHRDTHFSVLEELSVGEDIHITTEEGVTKLYRIATISIVNSQNEQLQLNHTQNQLTLITCYPFDALAAGGPLRLRVDAYLEQSHSYVSYLNDL